MLRVSRWNGKLALKATTGAMVEVIAVTDVDVCPAVEFYADGVTEPLRSRFSLRLLSTTVLSS